MDRPDLLSRVQRRGRLYGRNESRRVIRAVIDILVEAVPVPQARRLAMRVATETGGGLPDAALSDDGPHNTECDCRAFITAVAQRLFTDEPNAAFLSRVVFGELNAAPHGITPAALTPSAPLDLRALLSAEAATESARPSGPTDLDQSVASKSVTPRRPSGATAPARRACTSTVGNQFDRPVSSSVQRPGGRYRV
jgi:hypothetical protein